MSTNIESHLIENRVFKPAKSFSKKAHISSFAQYQELYRQSIKNPEKFFAQTGRRTSRVAEEVESGSRMEGAFCEVVRRRQTECLRELPRPASCRRRRNKAALIWEGEPGDKVTLTYQQLHREVCKFANVLKRNHIKKGDRIIIYMPMCPEAVIAMLACARLGAIHSVVFGGFSSESIKDRIKDSQARMVITADGDIGAEPLYRSRRTSMRHSQTMNRSSVSSFFGELITRFTLRKAGMCGGIGKWNMWMQIAHRGLWILRTRYSFSTPAVRLVNRREYCTPVADTCSVRH